MDEACFSQVSIQERLEVIIHPKLLNERLYIICSHKAKAKEDKDKKMEVPAYVKDELFTYGELLKIDHEEALGRIQKRGAGIE